MLCGVLCAGQDSQARGCCRRQRGRGTGWAELGCRWGFSVKGGGGEGLQETKPRSELGPSGYTKGLSPRPFRAGGLCEGKAQRAHIESSSQAGSPKSHKSAPWPWDRPSSERADGQRRGSCHLPGSLLWPLFLLLSRCVTLSLRISLGLCFSSRVRKDRARWSLGVLQVPH